MPIFDLYSKRLRRSDGEPDVYSYTSIPRALRVTLLHMMEAAIGVSHHPANPSYICYKKIESILKTEYGLLQIAEKGVHTEKKLEHFLLEASTEQVLDVVELACKLVPLKARSGFIDEINQRLREAAIGYKFESGQIMRIDSEFVHQEIVKPALVVLSAPHFAGAQEEFLQAHAHYRGGNFKSCLAECLKSFESAMKGICSRRGWHHDSKATAKTLLDLLFANGLVPELMQNHFSGLRSTLESGIPTVRNRMAGHGQGPSPVNVPLSIASYILHLTASTIVLLASLDAELS
jgi:hypothetical protein